MVLRILLILLFSNCIAFAQVLKTITAESFYKKNPSEERKAILDFIIQQFDGKSVTQKQLDALWNNKKIRDTQDLIRFQIVDQKLYVITSNPEGLYSLSLISYFQNFLKNYKIPDIDFIIYDSDFIYLDENQEYDHIKIPTFMMSKNLDSKQEKNQLLLPDAYIINYWHKLAHSIPKSRDKNPWDQKINKIFWRGGTTGVSDKYTYSISNLDKIERLKLVMLSTIYPDLIDADFTWYPNFSKDSNGKNLKYLLSSLFPNSHAISEEDHLKYKYLISIDGQTCAWLRIPWIMISNSVLVKQDSSRIEWFYPAIKPYIHYVPLKQDLTDIFEQISWMKANDNKLQEISLNAQKFIESELMPEHIDSHMAIILNQYATIQKDKKIQITLEPAEDAISMLDLVKLLIYKTSRQFILRVKSWF